MKSCTEHSHFTYLVMRIYAPTLRESNHVKECYFPNIIVLGKSMVNSDRKSDSMLDSTFGQCVNCEQGV
jgi:hypothetical protein